MCFLFSYVNPDHEQAVRERFVARGLLEPWPRSRSPATFCPIPGIRARQQRGAGCLRAAGDGAAISTPGRPLPDACALRVMNPTAACQRGAGPSGGAYRVQRSGSGRDRRVHLAKLAGFDHILTLDIGGTSTDVALCPGAWCAIRRRPSAICRCVSACWTSRPSGRAAARAGGRRGRAARRAGERRGRSRRGDLRAGRTQITLSDANALLGRLDAGASWADA